MSNRKPKLAPKVSCPKCGRKQDFTGPDAEYFCNHCKMLFDTSDDGGDFGNRPEARIERQERQQERQREQRLRRLGARR